MRATWRLPEPERARRHWQLIEVLLAFNGPQLTLVRADDGDYLSVASDESARATRWLRARVSPLERRALLQGGVTVRELLWKPALWVVDTNRAGETIQEFVVQAHQLHEDELPEPDSFLPPEAQDEVGRATASAPVFFLDNPSLQTHAITFRVLADVMQQIQRLWTAMGQMLLGRSTATGPVAQDIVQRTELLLGDLIEGSVGLRVQPADADLFSLIGEKYAGLVAAGADPEALSRALSPLGARVRATYADYLATLQKHRMEVLACWDRSSILMTPAVAARIEPSLDRLGKANEERFEVTGYFTGFNQRDADFELVDPESDERYRGRVSPNVLRSDVVIVIGPSRTYRVGVSIVTAHSMVGSPRHYITLEWIARDAAPPKGSTNEGEI